MKPPSVVMLIASFRPAIGGAETQALEISRFLKDGGARVRVLTRRLPGTKSLETIEGVPVRRLFCPGGGMLNSLWFMAASFGWLVVNGADYGVIHVHLAASHALAACLAARLTGKKVVVTVGGGAGIGELAASSRTIGGRLKLSLLPFFAPKLLLVTPRQKPELEKYGLGGLAAEIFPNAVDTDKFSPPPPEEKLRLRRQLGLAEGIVFLYAGRLAPEKRLAEFIEVWAKAGRGAQFIIAGDGPEEYRIRAAAAGPGNVIVAGRADNIADYYRACDVFVLPSVSEGLSCALLEAMACGMAVMATSNGGSGDAVAEGESGFLFDPLDAETIAAIIRKFISNPQLAAEMGAKARKTAASRYDMKNAARALAGIYEGL
ncbi:MAG: glycosyltransferase family 4 protein [Elusimicrobiales bacterium]